MKPTQNSENHAKLLGVHAPASAASGVVFLGEFAFDLRRSRILWRHDLGVVRRSVPARDSLIVTASADRVVVLRGSAPAHGWRGILPDVSQGSKDVLCLFVDLRLAGIELHATGLALVQISAKDPKGVLVGR